MVVRTLPQRITWLWLQNTGHPKKPAFSKGKHKQIPNPFGKTLAIILTLGKHYGKTLVGHLFCAKPICFQTLWGDWPVCDEGQFGSTSPSFTAGVLDGRVGVGVFDVIYQKATFFETGVYMELVCSQNQKNHSFVMSCPPLFWRFLFVGMRFWKHVCSACRSCMWSTYIKWERRRTPQRRWCCSNNRLLDEQELQQHTKRWWVGDSERVGSAFLRFWVVLQLLSSWCFSLFRGGGPVEWWMLISKMTDGGCNISFPLWVEGFSRYNGFPFDSTLNPVPRNNVPHQNVWMLDACLKKICRLQRIPRIMTIKVIFTFLCPQAGIG